MNLSSTNFHLQLPHWVLERYFPDFLYAQRFTHFWPTPWHMLLNYISFASTLIAVLACAYEGRWTMKLHSSKSVLVHHQFKAYLLYHGIFYALELLTTNMWELFTSMCYHHMLAIVIFSRYFIEPHTISVLTIIPILAHSLFWVLTEAESMELLFVYNWIFLLVGFITIVSSIASNGKRISIIMSSLCVIEVSCNLFTYCWDMRAMECRPVFSWIHPQNYKLSLVAGISAIAATLILLCMGVGKLVKAYYPIVDNELSGSSIRKLVQSKTAKKISRRNLKKSMLLKEE